MGREEAPCGAESPLRLLGEEMGCLFLAGSFGPSEVLPLAFLPFFCTAKWHVSDKAIAKHPGAVYAGGNANLASQA